MEDAIGLCSASAQGTVSRPVVPPFAPLRPAGSDLSRYPDIALDSSRRYSMQMRPAIFVTFLFCYRVFCAFFALYPRRLRE